MSYLTLRERDGKVSLWVQDSNVWDLKPEEATPAVLSAVVNAYNVGVRHTQQAYAQRFRGMTIPFEPVDERKQK